MKPTSFFLIALSLIALLISSSALRAQITAAEELEIDKVFEPWKDPSVPGLAAGIIKDGRVVYLKGFGSANLETETRITPQTKFQLGEMSKQFTTLAILILEQQGRIARGEDIRKYLPELPAYENKITIGHLLNHSSGLHGLEQLNTIVTGASTVPTQAKALSLIASQKTLSFKPGTDFSFHESHTESVLMAEIVARSSDQSFADFVKANIFEPLGMKNSLIRDDSEAILTNVAEPYQKVDKGFKKSNVISSVVGAINAYCTAEDLAKWYLNFSKPNGELGLLVQKLDTPVTISKDKKFSYYWGDMVIGREFTHPERGLPIFWNFGLQGGYGTNVFRYIDQNIISFVLGNSSEYNGASAMGAIEPFVKELYTQPSTVDYTALKTEKLSAEELKSFEGHYWFQKAGYASKVFVENDTLRNQWLFSSRSVRLLPVADHIFQQFGTNEDIRLYNFRKGKTGMKLFFTYNDSAPDIMERYEPVIPTEQTLQSYTGTYYNETHAVLYSLFIEEGGALMAKNLDHPGIEFRAVKKDVFSSTASFMTALEFLRDKSDNVIGFKVNADGIQDVVFDKVPDTHRLQSKL